MRHLKPATRPAKKNLYAASALFVCAVGLLIAPSLPIVMADTNTIPVIAPGSSYIQTNLISDSAGLAPVLDPLLVNPWGISSAATSPFWVANNGTSTTQLIRGDVAGAPVVLNPSPQTVTIPGGLPTGTVANPVATEFVLPGACAAAPCGANFLFASITGNITGWDPNAPAAGSTTAVIAASHPGHVYTGLAYGNNGAANFIYAADFANNNIDVFNSSFVLQSEAAFPFTDPTIPVGYAPYNIQAVSTTALVVTYALVGMDGRPVNGVGNGYVRKFDMNGVRDLTFGIDNGALNAPWGVVIAPASFGIFGGALLIGNFGEGNPSIHAYNPSSGTFLGTIQGESGNGIVIDRLWALAFGNGDMPTDNGGDPNTLYFTAGLGNEEHGLFGKLNPTTATATSLIQFSSDGYSIGEGAGHIDVTVTRDGDVSGTATVNYSTFDQSQPNHASQKSDYEIAAGTLSFAPGETSKTFTILIVNDIFDEMDETIELYLSNATGAGVGLGSPNKAGIEILDNDTGAPTTNPIDETAFFVRQHYLDFLNREPDPSGFAFWQGEIDSCGTDAQCREVKRIHVSAAFFLSIEFQNSGMAAYLTHRAAFGANASGSPVAVYYGNFMRDLQSINRGVVFGQPGADTVLESNKVAFYNEFVTRPEFVSKYPSTLTNEQYVDNLLASANLSPSEVRLFDVSMTNAQENPPANPTLTNGNPRPASSGTARLQFNSAQTAMTLNATVNNIDFTGSQSADTNDNLTNAHIHASATVTPGTNGPVVWGLDRKSTRLNSSHSQISYAVFCLKKKTQQTKT